MEEEVVSFILKEREFEEREKWRDESPLSAHQNSKGEEKIIRWDLDFFYLHLMEI